MHEPLPKENVLIHEVSSTSKVHAPRQLSLQYLYLNLAFSELIIAEKLRNFAINEKKKR